MTKVVGLSHMAISRIWHTFGLQPHRTETFELSTDPLLVRPCARTPHPSSPRADARVPGHRRFLAPTLNRRTRREQPARPTNASECPFECSDHA
jgi:hypothetical protein